MPLDLYLGVLVCGVKTYSRWANVPVSLWCSCFGSDGRYFCTARDVLSRSYSRSHDERGFSIAVRTSHPTEKPSDMVPS